MCVCVCLGSTLAHIYTLIANTIRSLASTRVHLSASPLHLAMSRNTTEKPLYSHLACFICVDLVLVTTTSGEALLYALRRKCRVRLVRSLCVPAAPSYKPVPRVPWVCLG